MEKTTIEKIDRKAAIGFLQIKLLQKFLNDPNRLGMTESEQKAFVDKIEDMK